MRCSTVTPGKFATFCRRPVMRLNSVDLPELGGPIIATTCARVVVFFDFGGAVATAHPPQLWQSLMASISCRCHCWPVLGSSAMLSRAATPLPIHPLDKHGARLRELAALEPQHVRGGSQAPSNAERHHRADPGDR